MVIVESERNEKVTSRGTKISVPSSLNLTDDEMIVVERVVEEIELGFKDVYAVYFNPDKFNQENIHDIKIVFKSE